MEIKGVFELAVEVVSFFNNGGRGSGCNVGCVSASVHVVFHVCRFACKQAIYVCTC